MVKVVKHKTLAVNIPSDDIEAFLAERLDAHGLAIRYDVAAIIAELEMPSWCQMVGFLGGYGPKWAEAHPDFCDENPEFNSLCASWAKLMPLVEGREISGTFDKADSIENLRRMLLAMVDDPQLVVLVLAEYLGRLRHCDKTLEETKQLALVVRNVYAPLANRLGMWQIKWELEDLSLKALDGDSYKRIAKAIDLKREQRIGYLENVVMNLEQPLKENNIEAQVSGRPKHIYSIHKKMQLKDVAIDKIMDMHALRIICDDVHTCYRALGVVHTLWQPIANQFEDYIAVPKSNGYQSIHTGVIGPQGRIVEVQIRTEGMHEHNELGVAAHWRYKEGIKGGSGIEERILWLRELLNWRDEDLSEGEFDGAVSQALSDERIYIFTPKGQVLDLPNGATSLDFAYSIHTQVGHQCRGAKVNGRIVPLTHVLQSGDQVEVLTSKTGEPSRDWLVPAKGYLVTSRARARVQRYFRVLDYEQNIAAGRQILEKELSRVGLRGMSHDTVQRETRYDRHDDFLEAIGRGEIKIKGLLEGLAKKAKPENDNGLEGEQTLKALRPKPQKKKRASLKSIVEIDGLENIVVRMAGCCHPLPGDTIVGYLTSIQGITIHRRNCHNIKQMAQADEERLFSASWSKGLASGLLSILEISAYDRTNIVSDITSLISNSDARLESMNMEKDQKAGIAQIRVGVTVADREELGELEKRIEQIPSIIYCRGG